MSVESLTLIELNKLIKTTIERNFDSSLWLIAEINTINHHRSGHCYLEFVQKAQNNDQIIAKARATIWSTQYRMIDSYFQSVTNTKLDTGMKVLVRVSIDFHELYGFSLNVRDIDPNYTLGDIERRKNEIIDKLKADGVMDMNKSIDLPEAIQKIAIISSSGAAGYEDFIYQLRKNKYAYKFDVELFEADMQGANTEKSIIKAFGDIFDSEKEYDIVAIMRGGGSKSDLSFFDNYNIAYHITQFPIPVFSGIGHERDDSVTDMVAHTKIKTPTAVANYIVEYNLSFESKVINIGDYIFSTVKETVHTQEMYLTGLSLSINKTKSILSKNNDYCNELYFRLKNAAKNQIQIQNYNLNYSKEKLFKIPINIFANEKQKIESLEQHIKLTDPKNVLERGFSITRHKGKIVSTSSEFNIGDEIETVLFSKTIKSKINKVE